MAGHRKRRVAINGTCLYNERVDKTLSFNTMDLQSKRKCLTVHTMLSSNSTSAVVGKDCQTLRAQLEKTSTDNKVSLNNLIDTSYHVSNDLPEISDTRDLDHNRGKKTFKRDDSGYSSDENLDSPSTVSRNLQKGYEHSKNESLNKHSFTEDEISQNPSISSAELHSRRSEKPTLVIKSSNVEGRDTHETDDEGDVIIVSDRHCVTSDAQPDTVDGNSAWARDSWHSPVEEKLIKYGTVDTPRPIFLWRQKQEPDQKSSIYIPHKYKDQPLGDSFGASVWTFKLKGRHYFQHFFQDVQPVGPASLMKICKDDELVLVNNTFLPKLDHTDVLNVFNSIPVDGKTRLKLVIRRIRAAKVRRISLKNEFEWIETSAILSPDPYDSCFHVDVTVPYFKELTDGELTPQLFRYKVSCTYKYLAIDRNDVTTVVLTNTNGDEKANITRRCRMRPNTDPNGQYPYIYEAALCNYNCASYIGMDEHSNIIATAVPVWFNMLEQGSDVTFRLRDKYLGCNMKTGSVESTDRKFSFECICLTEGVDHPDGSDGAAVAPGEAMDIQSSECESFPAKRLKTSGPNINGTDSCTCTPTHASFSTGSTDCADENVQQEESERARKQSIVEHFRKTKLDGSVLKSPTTGMAALGFS